MQPIRASRSRSASPGWVVSCGQPSTVTEPPVTAARARKGAALERSGSMTVSSAVTGPGATRQRLGSASSTSTPWRRSSETVISMCGIDGTGLPSCSRSTPLSYRAPASSSAETNCEDAEASTTTWPPGTAPDPRTTNGRAPRPSSSTVTPRPRSALSTSPTGRVRMCGSPSKATDPLDRAATGGTNLSTVPASPQSTSASRSNTPGATAQSSPVVSTSAPRDVRAAAISDVSRDRRARRTTDGPSASAASTSARFVSDLLPGSETDRLDRVRGRVAPATGPRTSSSPGAA